MAWRRSNCVREKGRILLACFLHGPARSISWYYAVQWRDWFETLRTKSNFLGSQNQDLCLFFVWPSLYNILETCSRPWIEIAQTLAIDSYVLWLKEISDSICYINVRNCSHGRSHTSHIRSDQRRTLYHGGVSRKSSSFHISLLGGP